jgi:hypothetical protein
MSTFIVGLLIGIVAGRLLEIWSTWYQKTHSGNDK